MHLKAVEIEGFKSFAERVKVEFDTGITSIVGPNGSGKSNILDAILWVLGEQSYKNIRAKDSSDVIFAGGKNTQPKNKASVSLFILMEDEENKEDKLVKITRSVQRGGGNTYFINNSKARLKDIHDLFLDTGVGKSAYSVIGQGKVERIISSSSKEIRGIIEEAAGIKRVQMKKAEAVKKLGTVEEELEKVALIIREQANMRNSLGEQSEKAKKHLLLKNEKEELEANIYYTELEKLKVDRREKENILRETKEKFHNRQAYLQKIEGSLELKNKERTNLYNLIENNSQESVALKEKIEKINTKQSVLEERKKSLFNDLEGTKEALQKLKVSGAKKKQDIDKVRADVNEAEEIISKNETENNLFEESIQKLKDVINETQAKIHHKKDLIMTHEVSRLRSVNEVENNAKKVKASEIRLKELEDEFEEVNKQTVEVKTKKVNLTNDFLSAKTNFSNTQKEIADIENRIGTISNEMTTLFNKSQEENYNLKRFEGKLDSLVALENSNEGFYQGVKSILNANLPGVHGAFINLISIPTKLQKAIEASISGNLQDVIVENNISLKGCINYLKVNQAGRASFYALDNLKPRNLYPLPSGDGILGRASDLITFDSKYKVLCENILGNILVVENLDIGLELSKKNSFRGNIVTTSGEYLTSHGRISGGSQKKSVIGGLLERKKEIETLKEKLVSLQKDHSETQTKHQKATTTMSELEDKLETLDNDYSSGERKIYQLERELSDIDSDEEKLNKHLEILKNEQQENLNYLDKVKSLETTSSGETKRLEELMESIKEEIATLEAEQVDNNNNLTKKQDESSDSRIKFLNTKEKVNQLKNNILNFEEELRELSVAEEEVLNKIEYIQKQIEITSQEIESLKESFQNENDRYLSEHKDIKEQKDYYKKLEGEESQLISEIKEVEVEIIKSENNLQKLQETLQKLTEVYSRTSEKFETLRDENPDIQVKLIENTSENKKHLASLDNSLRSIGVVNLLAIDEFKRVDEKFQFLKGQQDDLLAGKKSLLELIMEVEDTIKHNFLKTYQTINENFNYMCMEILNNSEGKLTLLEPDNILETGIELLVRYKNKKQQSISLLSGGEKSMVAVAFIMAIFMYKPSPFTFFDEIEAALDDINTRRLIQKLKEFTDRSQFILITHNKETMKESDTLYGVTMNKEIGESKIMSVKM